MRKGWYLLAQSYISKHHHTTSVTISRLSDRGEHCRSTGSWQFVHINISVTHQKISDCATTQGGSRGTCTAVPQAHTTRQHVKLEPPRYGTALYCEPKCSRYGISCCCPWHGLLTAGMVWTGLHTPPGSAPSGTQLVPRREGQGSGKDLMVTESWIKIRKLKKNFDSTVEPSLSRPP